MDTRLSGRNMLRYAPCHQHIKNWNESNRLNIRIYGNDSIVRVCQSTGCFQRTKRTKAVLEAIQSKATAEDMRSKNHGNGFAHGTTPALGLGDDISHSQNLDGAIGGHKVEPRSLKGRNIV